MTNIFTTLILNVASADLAKTIFQVQVSLLSANLVFLGLVQFTLSTFDKNIQHHLFSHSNYLLSKSIIRSIRLLIGVCVVGTLVGCIDVILPNFVLGILLMLHIIVTLCGIWVLTYNISKSLLNSMPGKN